MEDARAASGQWALHGAADLIMWQAEQRALSGVDDAGEAASRAASRSAAAVATARALAVGTAGLGVLAIAWVGGPALADGRLSSPVLALLILLPLALLEVISPLADVGPLQVRV